VTADWVAVAVRGRGLLARRLGRDGVRSLANLPSLDRALSQLTHTPYAHDLRPGMGLPAAQHAIYATLLWHLRILAGWAMPQGSERVRALAAGFEITNIVNHMARLNGRSYEPAYELGALTTAWRRVENAQTTSQVREELARSAWGDPGTDDIGRMCIALYAAWARRVASRAPEAGGWASAFLTLIVARALLNGVSLRDDISLGRNVGAVLGVRAESASTLPELVASVPHGSLWAIRDVKSVEDLWRAEATWWKLVEIQATGICAGARAQAGAVVGVVALLAVDAWRTRAALALAADGGARDDAEWLDAVA
jgi:hypothetical protein